jgi:Ca-activated chloride channel family protein
MIRDYFSHIEFAYPQLLFLLLLIPLLVGWYISRNNSRLASLTVSSLKSFHNTSSWKRSLRHAGILLRVLALSSLIIAMARPRSVHELKRTEGEGIDVVLCIDVSGSMLAQDLSPNRLEAAKQVAAEFVKFRPTDRIGLVIFAGESFTQCPITSDHDMLVAQIYGIRSGFMLDGTAIGSGLATSADRLRSGTASSRVVVLLTDGENNGGLIDPRTAKEIARTLGIRVYTIGVGTEGYAPTPVQTPGGEVIMQQEKVNIDEKLLREIALETGGRYFRARDNASLQQIYSEIDKLEKTKVEIQTSTRYAEKFHPLVMAALLFIFLELLLRFTVFRKFP